MDNKRVSSTPERPASARRWVAVIGLGTLLALAGGWVLGPGLRAQDKKVGYVTVDPFGPVPFPLTPAPVVPGPRAYVPSADGKPTGDTGKVGFVTVDPYEVHSKKLDQAKPPIVPGGFKPLAKEKIYPIIDKAKLPIVPGGLKPLAKEKASPVVDKAKPPIALDSLKPLAKEKAYPVLDKTNLPIAPDSLKPLTKEAAKPAFEKTKPPIAFDPAPFKLPVAPLPALDPVSAPPRPVEKIPAIVGAGTQPFVLPQRPEVKPISFAQKVESPKGMEMPAPIPLAPQNVIAPAPPQLPSVPPMGNEFKPIPQMDPLNDKAFQPLVIDPSGQVDTAAFQKDQPVPLPLPQVLPPPGGNVPPVVVPGNVLPQPRPYSLPPFGMDQPRMSQLGDPPLGMTPQPSAKVLAEQAKYVGPIIDPANTLDLIQGRARLMMMKATPKRIQISDETIVGYTVIDNKEMTILGKTPGTTVLNMWFVNKDDKTKETVLSYLVRVFPDPEQKERLERVFRALEIEINKHFPDSLVRLTLVGDKVMVTGQAHDIFEATQILKAVVANAPASTKTPTQGLANTPRPETPALAGNATPGQDNYISSGSPSVINMLRIGGVHQVMLRVVVAEVNRSAARTIGLNFSLTNNQGSTYFQNLTGGIATATMQTVSQAGVVTPVGNLPIKLDNGQVSLSVNALKRMNYAKSLAEPNLVTMNGQPAFFLAGGQFPVPVVAGNAVGGLQGTTFVPYGVQLRFTPFITDKDRIRLAVNATVSTRDTSTGTNIGNSAVSGLTSRSFSSTVEMRDGQTLAVAGLIQTNLGTDRDQLPFLGEIPFLNRFTGFDRTSSAEQELVILVTPELVQPMYHQQLPRLPGSDLFEPSDLEFYLLGRLEGRRLTDFRSPVMNDIHRIRQYNRVEQHYIFGPAGFYNIPLIPK